MTFRPDAPLGAGQRRFSDSISDLFRRILPFPLKLFRVATADQPSAADYEGAIDWDDTANRPAYSDGSTWQTLMPYTAGEALTRVDDTNVTLTLGGTPATALLKATSLTLGWTGQLAAARGGTGVSALGNITKADDTNVTLTLGGTPTGAVITSTSFTLGWSGTLAVSRGGTGGGSASGTLLDNITGFSSTGHLVRTASGTYAFRTVTGTSNEITVTNGSGVSANPTISIPSAVTLTGKTMTGGTFNDIAAATVVNDQNSQTGMRVDNANAGTSASALFDFRNGALGTGDRLLFGITGTGYTAVTGWQDSGIIATQANISGGLILNSNGSAGIKFEVGGNGSANQIAVITTAGLDVAALVRCNSFRIDATPTAETPAATHTVVINLNGTNYKFLCLAA